ncbi:hypothetical protein CDD83_1025 [Cordyceps sp. RAO-2017]|nr:hypothetical protein CDD83_1025 [Cordyceps sp. RAO-2017]
MLGPLRLALAGAAAASALQVPLQAPAPSEVPLVDSKSLQARIEIERLQERADRLYRIAKVSEQDDNWGRPTRVIGSLGHVGTLDYIRTTLGSVGGYYAVSEQTLPAVVGDVRQSRLVIDLVLVSATAFALTPPTLDRQIVHGDLFWVGGVGCNSSDYPLAVEGNIALARRGDCPFGTKSELAGRAGAIALIVVNDEPGELHGTLGTPAANQVATFGLSKADGDDYIDRIQHGEVIEAFAFMDAFVRAVGTTNIVAQTVSGDQDNCVMLGAHSDSVPDGPGINDDGSGALSLLEVAVQLSHYRTNNCVRFAWMAAEEEGLVGSYYYVDRLSDDENRKIRLFMDYDMMASPNFAYQVYNATDGESPPGSQKLRDLYVAWYDDHGLNHTLIPFNGRSDYDGFIRHGIPAGGIATGAEEVKTDEEQRMFGGRVGVSLDPCYHQKCDDLNNLNLTAWELNTKLIAHSVAEFAVSFDGFPERTLMSKAEKARLPPSRYRGPKPFM